MLRPVDCTSSPSTWISWRLFALSFIALFLELVVIRWSPSVVRLIAYYANLMLISSFLGLGVGAMLAGKQRDLFGWFPMLLAIEMVVLWASQHHALPSSPAEVRFYSEPSRLLSYVVLVAIFLSNALTFVPLGQRIGVAFQLLPPLRAYAWDLGGSLAGTVAFGIFSFTHFSPLAGIVLVMVLYAMLSERGKWLRTVPLFVVVLAAVGWSNDPAAVWSPYYYIRIRPMTQGGQPLRDASTVAEPAPNLRELHDPPLYSVSVNQDFYQVHGTLDPSRYTSGTPVAHWLSELRDQYFLPYEIAPRHQRVVVLGAGGGADVEAALLRGAQQIDAVEIDPGLVALSRRFSAADVYGDARVTVHINDARAFLQSTPAKYDMVVFGFLDSQALFSYMTNLRLDGYIYTIESFRRAWEVLGEEGTLVLSYTVARPWLGEKLLRMVYDATGRVPLVYVDTKGSTAVMIVPRRSHALAPASYGNFLPLQFDQTTIRALNVPPATDDWPYLYLSQRTIPRDYLVVIGSLVAISLLALLWLRGRSFASADWHFLFLGLGFLLLETKSISDYSLYFGATWAVTTIVISGILLMVMLANLVAMRVDRFSTWLYLPLIGSLLVVMLVSKHTVLSLPLAGRLAWALLVVPLPIFFAGLIFSTTFRRGEAPARLIGANLIGAMIGGFCEYLGMAVGHGALMWIVIAAYMGSLAFVRRARMHVIA